MAKGDKKPVVMESDRAVPSGIATLDASGNVPFEQLGNVAGGQLLDNADFLHLVNQRGQTEYTAAGYSIDRWKKSTAYDKVIVETGGLRLVSTAATAYNTISQPFEFPKRFHGRTVTISAVIDECVNVSGASIILRLAKANGEFLAEIYGGIKANGLVTATGDVPAEYNGFAVENIQFVVRAPATADGEILVKGVGMNFGSTQKIFHQDADGNWVLNEIPDYGEELAKCQRYFLRVKVHHPALTYAPLIVGAYAAGAELVRGSIPLPVPMRANPETSFGGSLRGDLLDGHAIENATVSPVTSVSTHSSYATHVIINLNCSGAAFQTNVPAIVQANNDGAAYIDLSADL